MSFDPRILSSVSVPAGCRCPKAFAMLGSSSGALNFALSQNKAIVADLAANNPTQAVRDALVTPWNPHPTDAQVQAALSDPQNAQNVLLIIQRAGATPEQLKTIPQPGHVNYQSPAVTAALKQIASGSASSGGTATPAAPAAPAPTPPAPAPAPAPASTGTSSSTASTPPTTNTSLTPDQVSALVGQIQTGMNATGTGLVAGGGSVSPGMPAPPAGFTYGPDGVTLVPLAGAGTPAGGTTSTPLSTGPLDFLSAPLAIPFVNVSVPTWLGLGGAAALGWFFFRGRSHG